ncbi:MAG: sugar kinase [Devosiaceae bacterium]|nr:sugar kinase [Devosiaceae bacterium MH13]
MTTPDILALGEPLIEMVRREGPADGPATYTSGVGGDALNALVAAARQGAKTGLVSALGDDPFGHHVRRFCESEGIDTSALVTTSVGPTGVSFIHPDPGARHFTYARRGSAASQYRPSDVPLQTIAQARALHVTGVSQAISPSMRDAVQAAAETARANGTLVSYDLNLRLKLWPLEMARACIQAFLPLADIVLPSDDEAERLLGTDDPGTILDHFARHGAQVIVLKRGPKGVIVRTAETDRAIPAPKVDAIDSSGAGDSFAGAFLAHFLETGDALQAASLAVRVAALTVTGHGATAAIPRREDLLPA